MAINSRFGRRQVITVPGSSETSMTDDSSGSTRNFLNALKMMKDDADKTASHEANKKWLKLKGFTDEEISVMSPEATAQAAQHGGQLDIADKIKAEEEKRQAEILGNLFIAKDKNTKMVKDAQFQGFSPSEDAASKKSLSILDNLISAGSSAERALERTTPPPGTSLPDYMATGGFQGRTAEHDEGIEGSVDGGSDQYSPVPPGSDREMFGDEPLNHVEGLNSNIITSLNNDPEQVGLYMKSETYKQQLEQAQARDRDVVEATVADLAQRNTVSNKVFQHGLDIEQGKISKLHAEEIEKRKEIRALKTKINEEGRAADRAKLVRAEERLAKMTDDSRKRIHDYNLSIFNRWEDEQKTKRKEQRAIKELKENNIKHAKAVTKLLSRYHEGQIDPNITQKQAMINALTVSDKKGSLSIEERALLTNDDIKLLGQSGTVILDLFDNKSGENRKYEYKTVDGVIDLKSKRLIGATKHGIGDALLGRLQKGTKKKIEAALIDNEIMALQYEKLGKYLDNPENLNLLSTFGNFDFWQMQKRDRLGNFKFLDFLKLSKSDQARLRRYTQMAHLTGRIFTAFRKSITGVAGPVEEFKRLEEISLSISMQGPVGFVAAYDLLVSLQEDERTMLRSTLAAGNMLETPEQKARYREGLIGRINARINALKEQGFGNAIKDVDDMVESGEITLTISPPKDLTPNQKLIIDTLNNISGN